MTDDQNGVISCVWIPAGQWRQEQKILTDDPLNRGQYNQVGISNVTIRGAGMWYSQLYSLIEPQNAGGINHPHEGNFGFDIDKNTQISDIATFGSGRIRGGDGNAEGGVALNGRFGIGTKITNVWIEHSNVGVWVGRDYDNIQELWGPADGLEFSGMRIRDTYADGINFTNGSRNSRVFNSSFRTTGDDALAVWASKYVKDQAVHVAHDNQFLNNTVQLPWRANGMRSTVVEVLSGTRIRSSEPSRSSRRIRPSLGSPSGTPISTTRPTTAFSSRPVAALCRTSISNVRIDKSNNGAGILAMGGARGSATLTNVTITNSADGNIVIQPGSSFVITNGSGAASSGQPGQFCTGAIGFSRGSAIPRDALASRDTSWDEEFSTPDCWDPVQRADVRGWGC